MVWHGRGWGRERSSPLSSSFWVVVSRYALATLAISVAPTPHVEDRIWLRSVDFAPCFIYFFIIIISLDCNPCVSLYSGITPPPPSTPLHTLSRRGTRTNASGRWLGAACCVVGVGWKLKVSAYFEILTELACLLRPTQILPGADVIAIEVNKLKDATYSEFFRVFGNLKN